MSYNHITIDRGRRLIIAKDPEPTKNPEVKPEVQVLVDDYSARRDAILEQQKGLDRNGADKDEWKHLFKETNALLFEMKEKAHELQFGK